jgi:hypothetical protein
MFYNDFIPKNPHDGRDQFEKKEANFISLNRFRCLELKHVEKPFCLNCKESWQA